MSLRKLMIVCFKYMYAGENSVNIKNGNGKLF